MKKLICVIPITVLICILLSNEKSYAYAWPEQQNNVYIAYGTINGNVVWCIGSRNNSYGPCILDVNNRSITFSYWSQYANEADAINGYNNNNYMNTGSGSRTVTNIQTLIVMKGSLDYYPSDSTKPDYTYDSYDDYLNPVTPTPTPVAWYQGMWNTLQEELGNPAFWFGEWFIDIIDQVFGNDEEPSQGPSRISDSTHIKQVTPAPTPSPIPYSTITVPRTDIITGQTVYETNYYYVNPSGTPIVATSPPTNPPAQNDTGGGSGNDYNPVDPYSIPDVSWFTAAEIGDTSYDGIDSIMQGFESIDTIGNDYTDGMSAVEDATGVLPTSWLLLIGIAAAIPLIAGIISRFLS